MFAKVSSVVVLALAAFAVAAPGGFGDDHFSASADCNSGGVYCCNQIQTSDNYDGDVTKALLALKVDDITGQAGVKCIPVAVGIAAATGGKCQTDAVCCKDYDSASLVGLNCNNVAGQV